MIFHMILSERCGKAHTIVDDMAPEEFCECLFDMLCDETFQVIWPTSKPDGNNRIEFEFYRKGGNDSVYLVMKQNDKNFERKADENE